MNPLLAIESLPEFSLIKPEHVIPAIDQVLTENREVIQLLTQNIKAPSWDNFIQPLEQAANKLNRVWSPVSHLNSVMNSDSLKEAYQSCLPKLSEYNTELGQNKQLFEAYQAIEQADSFTSLSESQQKTITNALRDFKLAGIDLAPEKQTRYKEIKQQLSKLTSDFQQNVMDATLAWSYAIEDESRLSGLTDSAKALMSQAAKAKSQEGWLLKLDFPIYFAVMSYADDQDLRKMMYEAYQTRASDQGPNAGEWDNTPLMNDIMALRHELSQLLSFANYAEYSLATKMASSPDEVLSFLNDLVDKSKSVAENELQTLVAFAKSDLNMETCNPWDLMYVAEKYKKATFDVSQEEVKEYFPIQAVLKGMFGIVEKLFDIQITENKAQNVWHEEVHFFEIKQKNTVIAQFYLDLYARDFKRGGAWMDECVVRQLSPEGLQLPVAYLTCNFTPAVEGKPALLTHDEMTTLFHEFGHGLHHMLTQIDELSVSGINGVSWDAVELPSQFLENWCWQEEALALFSGHYETGEPLPLDMFNKMIAAKNFQSGMQMVRQLEFAIFDFNIHLKYHEGLDIYAELNAVRKRVAVIIPPENNRFAHGFSHIFAGGYAAGYYSYKWAEVLSSDAFAKFEEEGIFNVSTGQLFLTSILQQGGSKDAMTCFKNFRGRAPSIDALLRHSGMAA